MCKKLMFLISFVVVLGLVSSASAIDWTNADPGDDLWNTATNWDGNTVPGGGDVAIINSPPGRGPIIAADVTVGEIGGLRLNSNDDQVMDIVSGNVQIGWWWGLAEAGTGTATLNMFGNANIDVGGIEAGYDGTTVINIGGTTQIHSLEWRMCNEDAATVTLNITDQADIHMGPEKNAWRFADKGTMVTNISGDPNILIQGKWRNGDETGHSVVNMSGGTLYTERYMSCYDDGMATFSFSGGTVNVDGLSYAGGGGDLAANPYTLNVSGSASVTARTEIRLGYQADPLNVTQASVTLNQTGGTLETPGPFNAFGAKCPVNISLTGGQLRCGSFQDQPDTRPYSLYICGGELVVQGDVTAQMQADIDAGYITGCVYGGPPQVEFDNGETTLSDPGGDFVWTSAYPWSMQWTCAWNWDPVGVPSTCDDSALIEGPGGPVALDADITVEEILVRLHSFNQDIHIVKDADVYVCDTVEIRDDPCLATVTISDDAILSTHRLRVHDDDGDAIINMTENAQLICRRDLRFGDTEGDYFELNMTDNTYLFVENDGDRMRQNAGEFHIDLSGNAVMDVARIRARARTSGVTDTITVRENAQLICFDDYFRFAGGPSNVTVSILDNAVVDVDNYVGFGEDNDAAGQSILNMSGQLLRMGGDFRFCMDGGAKASFFMTVNLTGGVIDTSEGELQDAGKTSQWLVNQCGDGVWILDGDVVDEIYQHAEEGRWIACPMEDCKGEFGPVGDLQVDYDNVNPGKTTIWVEFDPTLPWAPKPINGADDVPAQGTQICWCPPEDMDVKDQFVWFSSDCDAVDNRNPDAFFGQTQETCVDLPCLELCTTYCWAVDTLDHYGNVRKGKTFTFTTECCRMIEDFESYTLDPWSAVYKSWKDGCGIWVGDELVGNGTGSCVNLGMENTHDGAKAMIYTYENDFRSLWERDVNYSEACREFDPALDLECSDDKALVIYFYGDPDNDVTDMWVKLNDVKSTYGANGEDPAAIQVGEWRSWNTKLSDFADGSADLSAITEICIGFGDDETNIADGTYGMMIFDCIQTCTNRCVTEFLPRCFGDHDDDCDVDWADVKVIADNWLTDRR